MYFKVMGFQREGLEYLNCRILTSKGSTRAKPGEQLGYTTSLENTKSLLHKFGLKGKFSEKTGKVSGVSEAVHQNVSLMDIAMHGRWKSLETPMIYMNRNKKRKLQVSNLVI